MAAYTVKVGGRAVAMYTEFSRAGRSGVRGLDCASGQSEEYGHRGALDLAEETARSVAARTPRETRIVIVRDDGTIAREYV